MPGGAGGPMPLIYFKWRISTLEAQKALEELSKSFEKTSKSAQSSAVKTAESLNKTASSFEQAGEVAENLSKTTEKVAETGQKAGNVLNYTAGQMSVLLPATLALQKALQKLGEAYSNATKGALYYVSVGKDAYTALSTSLLDLGRSYSTITEGSAEAIAELVQTLSDLGESRLVIDELIKRITLYASISGAEIDTLSDIVQKQVERYGLSAEQAIAFLDNLVGSFYAVGASIKDLNRASRDFYYLMSSTNLTLEEQNALYALFGDEGASAYENMKQLLVAIKKNNAVVSESIKTTGGLIDTYTTGRGIINSLLFTYERLLKEIESSSGANKEASSEAQAHATAVQRLAESIAKSYNLQERTAAVIASRIADAYKRGIKSFEDLVQQTYAGAKNISRSLYGLVTPAIALRRVFNSITSALAELFMPTARILSVVLNILADITDMMAIILYILNKNPVGRVLLSLSNLVILLGILALSFDKLVGLIVIVRAQLAKLTAQVIGATTGTSLLTQGLILLTKKLAIMSLAFLKVLAIGFLIGTLVAILIKTFTKLAYASEKSSIKVQKNQQRVANSFQQMASSQVQYYKSTISATQKELKSAYDIIASKQKGVSVLDEGSVSAQFSMITKFFNWLDKITTEIADALAEGLRPVKPILEWLMKTTEVSITITFTALGKAVGLLLAIMDWVATGTVKLIFDLFVPDQNNGLKKAIDQAHADALKMLGEVFMGLEKTPIIGSVFTAPKQTYLTAAAQTYAGLLEYTPTKNLDIGQALQASFQKVLGGKKKEDVFKALEDSNSKLWKSIVKTMEGYGIKITEQQKDLIKKLIEIWYDLGQNLIWGSVIPDMFSSIVKEFYDNKRKLVGVSLATTGQIIDSYLSMSGVLTNISSGIAGGIDSVSESLGASLQTSVETSVQQTQGTSILDQIGQKISSWWQGVVAGAQNFFPTLQQGFSAQISNIGNMLKNFMQSGVMGSISSTLGNIGSLIMNVITNPFGALAQLLLQIIPLQDIFNMFLKEFAVVLQPVLSALQQLWNTLVKGLQPAIQEGLRIIQYVIKVIFTALKPVFDVLVQIINVVIKALGDFFKALSGPIQFVFKVLGTVLLAIAYVIGLIWNLLNPIRNLILGIFGIQMPDIDLGAIKSGFTKIWSTEPAKLQKGGIVTKPTSAIIGEAGPEAVLPLSRLETYISPRGGNINITITGNRISSDYDVERIADKIVRELKYRGVIP